MEPIFSFSQTEKQLPLLIKIKEYLIDNLGFDLYSIHKIKSSPIIMISTEKAMRKSKPLARLIIKNIHLLNNYLIPFLSKENFITKKGEDFRDFKIICNAIYIGAHLREEIKLLIIKLSNTMNNLRLSTYLGSVEHLSQFERVRVINATPSIEHLSDGRQIDIATKKLIHSRSRSCVYEITLPSSDLAMQEEVLIMSNLAEGAKKVGVGFNKLKRRLDGCTSYGLE